jgi:RimK family alpha-L-glutamate ligase
MLNFSDHNNQINEAKKDSVVFAFGRMNPPTIGHKVVVDKVLSEAAAKGADHFIFVSKTQDTKKNPLSQKSKIDYLKKLFPKVKFPFGKSTNPFDTVLYLCELGYKNIYVVTGSDHVAEYNRIKEYKGKVATNDPKKRSYSFDNLEVIVAGKARVKVTLDMIDDMLKKGQQVDPMYMSASLMREAAFKDRFDIFSIGIPGNKTLAQSLWKDVRKGMSLKEDFDLLNEATKKEDVTIIALTSSEKDLSDTIEKTEAICKRRKIKFYPVKTSKAQVEISNVASKKITIKNYDGEGKDVTIVPENTVAIVRGGVMNTEIGVAIMTILQNNGVFMVNERAGMELCANKLETAIALKKHGLPHPRTAFVANEENIESAVKEVGGKFPIICKTLTGAEGIGVSKIESMESLKSVLQTLWKYGAEIIIQEFLPEFKNDVRSIVLNGKIFACAKRDKAPKDFRTNIARGSKGGSHQLSEEEIKLVEQAARVSKCFYVGIDHVINDGKPYIIEMNASPGSGNIYYRYYEDGEGKDNVKGEELVEDFVEYILNKAHWKLFSNLAVRENVKVDGNEYTAKIDTGNSGYNMIHADNIKDNGDHTVSFKLADGKKITKKIVSRIKVKSGIGEKERIVVFMDIEFHGKRYPNIKFSLGDRNHMSTKVLLGLRFLEKTGYVVDPANAIYPQPDVKKKTSGEEEEEEELSESIIPKGKANIAGALFKVMTTKEMVGKIFELSKLWKSNSVEFKKKLQDLKTEIVIDYNKSLETGAKTAFFVDRFKLQSIIDRILYKMLDVAGVDLQTYVAKLSSVFGSQLTMGYSIDGESIQEADITKGKKFHTKSGKIKPSPKDKKTGLPKKYVSGLSKREAELRKKRLAKRKGMSDDDPKTWEFVNPKEKKIKTKPSKYTTAFKKLAKKGKLKAENKNEIRESLSAIKAFENLDYMTRMNRAIMLEQKAIQNGKIDSAKIYRSFIEYEKDLKYRNYKVDLDISEEIESLLYEVSPPSGPARRFSKKEKIKKQFQKKYGKDWKRVFYATAWKMHKDSFESNEDLIEAAWEWTAKEKRGPLSVGTNKIVNTYRKDTPGERERLREEKSDEEKNALYKEWQKLVNMSGKEIQSFLDSEEGKEAGLSRKEAGKAGSSGGKITSGRDSARAIIRMLDTPKEKWTANDWKWAGKQVSFISRMQGAKGGMRDEKDRPTRKLLALKVWGHNPEKKS